ncbi:MAG: primosomal protein N' [Betaproteobacteria bacterium]|nr:MAG: primosomal protein N' [Betaproteobacteria bacterium]
MTIARVELDVPIPGPFDYAIGDAAVVVGALVAVPFGRRRQVGVVTALAETSAIDRSRLKCIERVLPIEPLTADTLALAAFCAEYYRHPLGQVLSIMLPTMLRKPDYGKRMRAWEYRFSADASELEASIKPRATGQRRLLQALQNAEALDAVQARLIYAGAPRVLREWVDKGWIEKRAARSKSAASSKISSLGPAAPPELTDEQQQAVDAISNTLGSFAPWLLYGVTGSGKTEVYLSLIERVAASGRQTLLLVPEINLTPQLEARVQDRFPDLEIVSLHSGLAEGERLSRWQKARNGQAMIVLGTRLAVFTPLPRLGLVIVDEEHDASFKQAEGLRYHARDLAVYVAKSASVPVLLGSATPSLETYANAIEKRYRSTSLTLRPSAEAPTVEFIDVRKQILDHGLSAEALAAISDCIGRAEQCLVYINRRGFAPVLLCRACGWMAQCQRCSARLTLHSRSLKLKCHYCGHEERIQRACPDCGNQDLQGLGQGTQRVEEALRTRLADARVLRVDSDSTRRRNAFAEMRNQIRSEQVDVLVGTQMLAKGHDFPKLTLVVILGADYALYSSDYRAGERLFQQLMQVAGRAGRADLPGRVLVQTEFPSHPVYQALARQDFSAYAADLLAERRHSGFPPYVYQAVLRAEAHREDQMWSFLRDAASKAASLVDANVTVYDCVPAPIFRVAGRYRGQLLLQAGSRAAMRHFLARWHPMLITPKASPVRWIIDVDPVEL